MSHLGLRFPSRRRRSTAVGALASACLLVLAACSGSPGDPRASAGETTKSRSATESPPAGTLTNRLPVSQAPHKVVFDDGFTGFMATQREPNRLWSGSPEGLGWIDPRTNDTHAVDDVPGVNIDVYKGYLYRAALLGNDVARYDVSETPRELVRREAPSPLNILAGPQGIWTSDHYHGRLIRLDPSTMETVKRIRLGTGKGLGPAGLVWQGKNLWVNVKRDQTVALVNGRTGAVLHRIHLPGADIGDDITLTSAGLWAQVLRADDTVSIQLIDTSSFEVIAHIDPGPGAAMPIEIDGETWMPVGDRLWHLAPNHGWQPDRIVDLNIPHMRARWAVAAFDSIWIATVLPSRIVRVPARDLP